MGILDSIAGQLFNKGTAQNPLLDAVMGLIGNQQTGGLAGLVQQFAGKGLGDIANSWVSTGANLPITPEQLKQGLGSQNIGKIAAQAGISPEAVTSQLSTLLPNIVDKLTPNGQISQEDIASKGIDLLKGLFK
jgi:uncharacterized protein YidB (DUF937 family)